MLPHDFGGRKTLAELVKSPNGLSTALYLAGALNRQQYLDGSIDVYDLERIQDLVIPVRPEEVEPGCIVAFEDWLRNGPVESVDETPAPPERASIQQMAVFLDRDDSGKMDRVIFRRRPGLPLEIGTVDAAMGIAYEGTTPRFYKPKRKDNV